VRDKLLGLETNDIDVTVDTMSGVEFAHHVTAYLASLGLDSGSIGVIQANPEQSKHLETATTRVHGAWIDFAHLRAEE
jgi:tRNA nucleotidyltransferase (CCA-adding enzyme)